MLILVLYFLLKSAQGLSATLPRAGLPYMGSFRSGIDPCDAAQFVSIARIREAELELAKLRLSGILTIDARLSLAHKVLDSCSVRSVNIASGGLTLFSENSAAQFNPDLDVW